MTTTSGIRLSENIRRAVKHSSYSISELGREGIEQAIIDDLVSVCWICGGGIHCKERRVTLDQKNFVDKYAHGELTDDLWPMNRRNYTEYFRLVERKDQSAGPDPNTYFDDVANRLNLPDYQHVDFCSSCAEYFHQIEEQSVAPTDIPVPYYYRQRSDAGSESRSAVTPPIVASWYVAEAISVNRANYFSHQRAIFNGDELSSEDRQVAQFWWAARARNERIIPADLHPWAEIAAWSHGESLWTGKPLKKIYSDALEILEEQEQPYPPLVGDDPLPVNLNANKIHEESGICSACGTRLHSNSYCRVCLLSDKKCSDNDCGGDLYPKIKSQQITESDVELCCETCGDSEPPSDAYAKALIDKYHPIFDEIKRIIPFHN